MAEDVTARWWVSWYEPLDALADCRPFNWPVPGVPAFWLSGQSEDAFTLCAVVEAPTEEEAKAIVSHYWNPASWRFAQGPHAKDWRPESSRFPWPEDGS